MHGPLTSMDVCRCRGRLLLGWLLTLISSRPPDSCRAPLGEYRFVRIQPRRLQVGGAPAREDHEPGAGHVHHDSGMPAGRGDQPASSNAASRPPCDASRSGSIQRLRRKIGATMPIYDRTNIPPTVGRGTLDPELEKWLPTGPTLGADVPIAQGRRDHMQLGVGPWPPIGAVDTLVLPGPHGSVAVRRHTPRSRTAHRPEPWSTSTAADSPTAPSMSSKCPCG